MTGAPTRRALGAVLAVVLLATCTETSLPTRSLASDVEGGPKFARDAGAILLQLSAYDYGLAGTLAGEKTRTVASARYATVVRGAAKKIATFNTSVLAAAQDRAGPIRDRLVPLADGLADLAKDGEAYADGGDPAAFARVVSGLTAGWQRLRDLASSLPRDDALQATIARGMSFVVTAKSATQFTVTAGPYGSLNEAQQALRAMGSPQNASLTQASPFTVRIGPYADRAAADAAAASLRKVGVAPVISEAPSFSFARSGPVPEAELWREPSRVQGTQSSARRLALSADGSWILSGADDGTAALYDGEGRLRALPQATAGISVALFSDDARFFAVGGQVVNVLAVPSGYQVGAGMRFNSAANQLLFVPTTRAFVAAAKGPTGDAAGGVGLIGGRAPDGAVLGEPFPIVTPAAGGQIAVSDAGDVYVGTTTAGGYDIEVFRPGHDSALRAIARIGGTGRGLAVDRAGKYAAAITDQGTFRFALADAKTLTRVGPASVRDLTFGRDGTLYLLDQTLLTAIGPEGSVKWTAALTEGRRIIAARRLVVVDGLEKLLVFAPGDGAVDELGAGGAVVDVAASADGRVIGAVVDARRAVLFTLP